MQIAADRRPLGIGDAGLEPAAHRLVVVGPGVDHTVLVGILRGRIHDEYILALIWKFLKAGYLEDWTFHRTYSGTPQGSIISPILSNIYLNEFDRYMEQYMASFRNGARREKYTPYWKLHEQIRWLEKGKYKPEIWEEMDETARDTALREIREKTALKRQMPAYDPMDTEYKRLQYVRYADDWICGVIGSKADAEKIKLDIKPFNICFRNLCNS